MCFFSFPGNNWVSAICNYRKIYRNEAKRNVTYMMCEIKESKGEGRITVGFFGYLEA